MECDSILSVSCEQKLWDWIEISVMETFFIQAYPTSSVQNTYEF
jgi:hypothetical protein